LSRFEELSRREAARTAILYAFDLIEHEGEDLRNLPFLDRKARLARLLRKTKAGSMAPTNPARAASGSRSAIPPASACSGSAVRYGIDEPRAVRADDDVVGVRSSFVCLLACRSPLGMRLPLSVTIFSA
jgi:hypothetical protein